MMAVTDALRTLLETCRQMDHPDQEQRPTEEAYLQALAEAEVALRGGGTVDTPVARQQRARATAREAARVEAAQACSRLTAAEREVLVLMCKGLTAKHCAKARETSHRTVECQMEQVLRKLDVERCVEAAVLATRAELV